MCSSTVQKVGLISLVAIAEVLRSLGLIADEEVSRHGEAGKPVDDIITLDLVHRPKKLNKKVSRLPHGAISNWPEQRPAGNEDVGSTDELLEQAISSNGDDFASSVEDAVGLAMRIRKKPRT